MLVRINEIGSIRRKEKNEKKTKDPVVYYNHD